MPGGGGLPLCVLCGIRRPKPSSAGSSAAVIWRPLFRGFPPKIKKSINGRPALSYCCSFEAFRQAPFRCVSVCRVSVGSCFFPAPGFIADESVSMLLRVWVRPPFTQIALLRLQRFLPLAALGMKPRLRYRSDGEAFKLGRIDQCPSATSLIEMSHDFVSWRCTVSNEPSYCQEISRTESKVVLNWWITEHLYELMRKYNVHLHWLYKRNLMNVGSVSQKASLLRYTIIVKCQPPQIPHMFQH